MPFAGCVGQRLYGTPLILKVDSSAMHRAEYLSYRSQNGVWLTDFMPPQFLSVLEGWAFTEPPNGGDS